MAKLLTGTRIYGTGTIDTQLFVSGINVSTSTSSGALQVVGGAGIGGGLNVGGGIFLSNNANYIYSYNAAQTSNTRMLGINSSNVAYMGPIDGVAVGTVWNAASTSLYNSIYAGGSEKVRIDSTGFLGVGYSATQLGEKLAVNGGGYFNGTVTATNFILNGYQVSTSTGGSASSAASVSVQSTLTNASFYPVFVSANTSTPTALPEYTTSSFVINPGTGQVLVGSNTFPTAVQNFTIVGDDTTGSGGQLHITGATTSTYRLRLGYSTSGNYGSIQAVNYGVAYTNLALQLSGGNVGIGTSNPQTQFVVSNAGANGLEVNPTGGVSSGVLLQSYNRSGAAYVQMSHYALGHTFNVGSSGATRAVDIDSSGRLGIGTTSPSYPLDVQNSSGSVSVRFKANVSGGAVLNLDATTSTGASPQLTFLQNGTNLWAFGGGNIGAAGTRDLSVYNYSLGSNSLTITSATNYVGIGTVSPSEVLHVSGTSPYILLQGTETSGQTLYMRETAGSLAWGQYTIGTRMLLNSSGQLLVGTTTTADATRRILAYGSDSNAQKIDVNNAQSGSLIEMIAAGTTAYSIGGWDSGGIIEATGGTGTNALVLSAYNGPLILQTNNRAERMRFTTAGGLSIGPTGTNYGTQGQVLTSNGNNPPTWNTASGPQGAQGFQGVQGATGSQGVQGSTGAQGVQGTAGAQGSVGAQGTTGAQGFQGVQGAAGAQGAQGVQGAQGATGSQGVQGAQGIGYFGLTSASSNTIASSGAFNFTTNLASSATAFQAGERIRIFSTASPANFMEGTITSFSGTAMVFTASNSGGSGTFAAWSISDTGVQGVQGAQGFQGVQGATGSTGSQGVQGATGSQGVQGATGSTGSQGFQGAAGAQGSPGVQGAQGATGAQGVQGATGTGSQGVQGATGSTGSQGVQGATGSTGSQGVQGATGSQGFQGVQGAPGNNGSTGSQGSQGVGYAGLTSATSVTIASSGSASFTTNLSQGTGTAFVAGQRIRVFSTASPTNYMEGTIATFSGTALSLTISNSGGSGTFASWTITDAGAFGAQGFQGFQGTPGNNGNNGNNGAQGFQGVQGAPGNNGNNGNNGAQGFQGVQGAPGNNGNNGSTGAQGVQGAPGNNGNNGSTGAQGAPGNNGNNGNTGAQGVQGAPGNNGNNGSTGAQGVQGAAGSTGAQGAQGVQGATGGTSGTITSQVAGYLAYYSAATTITGSQNITVSGSTLVVGYGGSSGSVNVAAINAPTNLAISGSVTATGNITAYSSDNRLKTKIKKITDAVDKVKQLSGFTYNWNELANQLAGYDMDVSEVGVFAQEVQAVLPEIVAPAPFDTDNNTGESKSGEDYLTVRYEKLTPLLIEAVKELTSRIEHIEEVLNIKK